MAILQVKTIDLESYEIVEKLNPSPFYKHYQIKDINTNQIYLAQMHSTPLNDIPKNELLDLSRKLNIVSKINHPSFLKFIGFSPNNFSNKHKSFFVMEYPENLLLKDFIDDSNSNEINGHPLTNTQKLIIIYGIASGMKYLHSNNVIHRSLNPYLVYLDSHFYPKISGLDKSVELSKSDDFFIEMELYKCSIYYAPEIYLRLEYSKASDVYSFALFLYQFFTGKTPFGEIEELSEFYENVCLKGIRPDLDESIPLCFRNLIEKCWSQDPENRPNFDEIESELRNNIEFISCFGDDFENEAFQQYLKYIDESPQMYESCEYKFDLVDDLLIKQSNLFIKPEKNNIEKQQIVNLDDYKKISYSRIEHKETGTLYAVKHFQNIGSYLRNEIEIIASKMNIISKLNHPSIEKFLGFSQVDFENEPNPFYLTEEVNALSLSFETPNILITLYGIASGMAYLHSHNILHRDLKSKNININNEGVPTITGFDLSCEINDEKIEPNKEIKGTPAYIAPEVYLHKGYSKKSDVYAFALVMNELFTSKRPYDSLHSPMIIKEKITQENYRPQIKTYLPKIYKELIEKCWAPDPNDRPSFEEIANNLKTNPGYLAADINKENFFEFVKYIDEYPVSFNKDGRVEFFDEILKTKLHTFLDINPNFPLKDMYQTEMNDLSFDTNYLDMNNLEISTTLIAKGSFYEVKEALDKNTNTAYAAKITIKEALPFSSTHDPMFLKHDIINFSRELNILLQLNHPSILKFIGHAPCNSSCSYLILTELSTKGSLEKLILNETSMNLTQKYIIIYGIAAGMSYLHANDVIHRDLKPANIYLDDSLYPKISGFNISKEINDNKIEPNETIKGTPAYIAPEIYLYKGYNKASDVYSFSLIVFELLTGTKPYQMMMNPKEIKTEVVEKNYRPQLTNKIPKIYQDLIEKCWSPDPKDRPTFAEIINELKNNTEYINDDMDKFEIQKYIEHIDKSESSFETSKKINQLDDYVRFKISKFNKIETKINRRNIWETETNNVSFDLDFISIKMFEKQKLIHKQNNFKYHEVLDTTTGKLFISKQASKNDESFGKLFSEIEIISQIHHPQLLNFIGYSPTDFKNRSNPVIFTENASNGTLERILQFESIHETNSIFNDTKKLIILYGIATGMSFLQSQNIAHGNLRPSSIFLDDFLFPKISGFENSSIIKNKNPGKFEPNPRRNRFLFFAPVENIYKSPEASVTRENHPIYDVYSFAMLAYYLITEKIPLEKESQYNESFKKICMEGLRPEFPESTPDCYKKLIEKCWSKNIEERPTFDEIAYHLRTNTEFITDKINKDEFNNYVQFVSSSENERIDDFVQTQNNLFRKVEIDFNKLRNWKKLHFHVDIGTLNIEDFEKQSKVGSGGFGSVYKCIEKKIEKIYAAKISIFEIDQCPEDIIINLSREIDIISALNHPSIFKYIGYSPNDFKNRPKPVIITEYAPNGSLDKIIEMEQNGFSHPDWDDTKKLINIYGIASGMRYLHYLDIIHRDLKPANILLDEFLYPKIADFGLSKKLTNKLDKNTPNSNPPSGFKGTYAYCAPEIITKQEYSQKGDVYSFGMIVYEILTCEVAYSGYNQFQLIKEIASGKRPQIKHHVPYSYKKLIEKCWDPDPQKRPSFITIVDHLETDLGFITSTVNKEEYLDYVSFVKDTEPSDSYSLLFKIKFHKDLSNINDYQPKKEELNKEKFKVSFDLEKIMEEEEEINKNFLDLTKYERGPLMNKGNMFKIYQVKEIKTEMIHSAQISMMTIGKLSNKTKDELESEIKIIKQMKHPSLLKFIGYSPINFKNKHKPVIVMEFFTNGTLENILEIERNGQIIPEWNSTKKLMNIYGIASAMSYLHSQGIVHRCLNPSNVFLDDTLLPKLGDFGLSTKFFNKDSITHQSITGFKGTPIYSAPEIIQFNKYTQKGDVYSFAFVVYEIMTSTKPFIEISNMNEIFNEVVVNKKRPNLDETKLPFCYRSLIERCWSQEQSERPTFEEIVYMLKMDSEFVTEEVSSDDYRRFIEFIEEQTEKMDALKVQEDENDQFEQDLNHEKEEEEENIENLEFLAKKYSKDNDTENTYKYFCMLIKRGRCDIPLEYAINLYKNKFYEQAFNYFKLLCEVNHPIARYYVGVMKFNGDGCEKDLDESYSILKCLSDNGIDRATEFLEDNFEQS